MLKSVKIEKTLKGSYRSSPELDLNELNNMSFLPPDTIKEKLKHEFRLIFQN